jgi:hypothetical protein
MDALKEVTFPIRVDATGDLADTGGKLIADSIERAHFVLLGPGSRGRFSFPSKLAA